MWQRLHSSCASYVVIIMTSMQYSLQARQPLFLWVGGKLLSSISQGSTLNCICLKTMLKHHQKDTLTNHISGSPLPEYKKCLPIKQFPTQFIFHTRRVVVWILFIYKPIAHCVKKDCQTSLTPTDDEFLYFNILYILTIIINS